MSWLRNLIHAVFHKPDLPDLPPDDEAMGAFRQAKQIRVSTRSALTRTIDDLLAERDRRRA